MVRVYPSYLSGIIETGCLNSVLLSLTKDLAAKSRTSFKKDDSSLGRVDTFFVAPPHTLSSLKCRIATVEGISTLDMRLYEEVGSDEPMIDSQRISLLAGGYPGHNEERPMAVVYAINKDT